MLKRKSYDNRNDGTLKGAMRPWSGHKRKTYDNRDTAFPHLYKAPAFFNTSPLTTDAGSVPFLVKEKLTNLLNLLKAQGLRLYMSVTGRGVMELYGPR